MKYPEISPNFTIEDIHKIREHDVEKRRILGDEAYWTEVRTDSLYMQEKIMETRRNRLSQESVSVNKIM